MRQFRKSAAQHDDIRIQQDGNNSQPAGQAFGMGRERTDRALVAGGGTAG